MTISEAKAYLEMLEDDPNVEYREDKIADLKKYIHEQEDQRKKREEIEALRRECSRKYDELTQKWLAAGAVWVGPGWYENGEYHYQIRPDTGKRNYSKTRWFYGNPPVCFFEWESGMDVIDHYEAARKADELFDRLREESM